MANLIDVLKERGFIEKTTHEQELKDYLEAERATCYIGFDPTASSLHVGSLGPDYVAGPHAKTRTSTDSPCGRRYRPGGGPEWKDRDAKIADPRDG